MATWKDITRWHESVIVEDMSEGRLAKRIFQSEGKASTYRGEERLDICKEQRASSENI